MPARFVSLPRVRGCRPPARRSPFAAAVASCGGGVDSGGTGAPATAFASGPITGFGSVIVNGVHFDDRSAAVSDADGNVRSRDDLRLGMTTDVRGSAIVIDADGNDASTATSIVFGSEIVGPVAASDLSARTLTVLGQTIDIAATTVFDTSLAGGQAALAVGDVVEVYGHVDAATGHYVATRIERKTSVAAFALRGIVAGLDARARSRSARSGLPMPASPPPTCRRRSPTGASCVSRSPPCRARRVYGTPCASSTAWRRSTIARRRRSRD